jgi:Histone deacetylase domain
VAWLIETSPAHDVMWNVLRRQDVHHGNGTQHILEDDPTIMYMSLHRYDGCAHTALQNFNLHAPHMC